MEGTWLLTLTVCTTGIGGAPQYQVWRLECGGPGRVQDVDVIVGRVCRWVGVQPRVLRIGCVWEDIKGCKKKNL